MNPIPPRRRGPEPSPAFCDPDEDGRSAMGVSDFTQLALWMAASLAGLMTAMLTARGPFFRAMAARVGWTPRNGRNGHPARRPTEAQALPMLADAIVGNSKSAVASVFGPPRGAVFVGMKHGMPPAPPTFWDADTWYYPLPRAGKLAIAIEFHEQFARNVQYLQGPRA